MSNIPKPILDALLQGKPIDGRNSWVRKVMKESREKEHQKKEEEQKRFEDFQIKKLEKESEDYQKLITKQKNTIEYIDYDCNSKDCDCKTARVILRPDTRHYAEIRCNLCDRHNRWLPHPNSNEECQFK